MARGLATDGERLWVGDWATGMALDVDGSLLVVETGLRRLSRVDPATGAISVVATDLDVGMPGPDGFPPTRWFDGVAVGPSGPIYVSENGRNVLTRIWPRPTTC